jgi:hypothetical protein
LRPGSGGREQILFGGDFCGVLSKHQCRPDQSNGEPL